MDVVSLSGIDQHPKDCSILSLGWWFLREYIEIYSPRNEGTVVVLWSKEGRGTRERYTHTESIGVLFCQRGEGP